MTSQSKRTRARDKSARSKLSKIVGDTGAKPFKELKILGEVCGMFLVSPEVSPDGSKFEISAGIVWIVNFGKDFYEHDIGNWLKKLKEPTTIRGFYCPAKFVVQFSEYEFEFTLEKNWNKIVNSKEPDLLINSIEISGQIPQDILNLPLARLKVHALQLAGVFGTAYPPNFRKYFAGGTSYLQTDENGGIDIYRYGFQITRSSALHYIQGENPKSRLLNDEILAEVARLHKTLPHGSKIQDIAQALNISERSARFYVAQARHPRHGLLEPTGRKRNSKAAKRKAK
ncbi:MAG: hypothetical protein FJX94_07795 [Bacteroidetes bacterium]|nr:hypothetical protein [Bacteroidota bacterium]